VIAEAVPPSVLAMIRSFIGTICLFWMARKELKTPIDRKDRKWFFLIGMLAYFVTFQMVQLGIKLAGASTAALINSTNPVVITFLAGIILKEPLTVIKRVCLFLALLGTFIITQGASGSGEIMGILFMIISVLSFGFASIQMRRLTQKYAPHLDYVLWDAHWQSPFSPCGNLQQSAGTCQSDAFCGACSSLPWHHGLWCGPVYMDQGSV